MNRRDLLKLEASVAAVPAADIAQQHEHAAAPTSEPDIAPGHRFFRMRKRMTAEIYYSTEIGFNELNKGGRAPATFGCRHPEHA